MNYCKFWSSRWRCSIKRGALKNFAIFTGKHLWKNLFLILKKTPTQKFPVNIAKFLGTPILKNICKEHLVLLWIRVNPFQSNVPFHMETNNLICCANQMTGFHMEYNTGLKWVKLGSTKFGERENFRPATLLQKRLQHRCFPVNFVKFKDTFFTEHLMATSSGNISQNKKSKIKIK